VGDWFVVEAAETGPALVVLARLLGALALGAVVAFIYRRARGQLAASESFTVTLILLSILIAMVTQVIGDNVARAFSLVGALSIVRFRTVVRDTQDTAYVIFAVAVGMAMGASNASVALGGIGVVGLAAFLTRHRSGTAPAVPPEALPFELRVRLALGSDPEVLLGPTLDRFRVARRLMLVATARQGLAVDVTYRMALADESAAGDVVSAINRVEGVQGVTLQRVPPAEG
jgi:hypothetical protein